MQENKNDHICWVMVKIFNKPGDSVIGAETLIYLSSLIGYNLAYRIIDKFYKPSFNYISVLLTSIFYLQWPQMKESVWDYRHKQILHTKFQENLMNLKEVIFLYFWPLMPLEVKGLFFLTVKNHSRDIFTKFCYIQISKP